MSPTKHTSSLPDTAPTQPLSSVNSARSLPALPSHFQLQGALLWGQGPRPLPAKDQPWGGVLPRAQLSFPKCLGLFTSLPMRLLVLAGKDLPVLPPWWGQPCISFASPFTSLLSSRLWVWASSGGHSVSGCLSVRMSVVECSPFLLLPLSAPRFPWSGIPRPRPLAPPVHWPPHPRASAAASRTSQSK